MTFLTVLVGRIGRVGGASEATFRGGDRETVGEGPRVGVAGSGEIGGGGLVSSIDRTESGEASVGRTEEGESARLWTILFQARPPLARLGALGAEGIPVPGRSRSGHQ